jgi:hypothetical protein
MYVWANGRAPAQVRADNWGDLTSDENVFRSPDLYTVRAVDWEEVLLFRDGSPAGRLERENDVWVPGEGLPELGGPDPLRVWTTAVSNLSRLRFIAFRDDPGRAPDLLIVTRRVGGFRDTVRVVMAPEGALASGPAQPGVWGKLNPQDIAFWVRATRRTSGTSNSSAG